MASSISFKPITKIFAEKGVDTSDNLHKHHHNSTNAYIIPSMSNPRPSSHGFQRTSTNKLFTRDIDTIFSMLMIALSPQEHSRRRKQSFLSPKMHLFSFTVEEALAAIQNLSVKIVSGSTKTTISCCVSSGSAGLFLERFMSARLLHCPADRTRSTPKRGTVLQPTAKGVFFIQRYCDVNGIIYNSPLLLSPLNSMCCFHLIEIQYPMPLSAMMRLYTFCFNDLWVRSLTFTLLLVSRCQTHLMHTATSPIRNPTP